MQIEPNIDHAALLTQLHELYGIAASALTFVPVGEAGVAYVVDCADGTRYFLKLRGNTRQGRLQQAKMDVYLPLTRELYERGLFRNLPYPIPTLVGALHDRYADYAIALFAYIDGQPLPYDTATYSPYVRDELARAIAAVHRATSLLHSPLPSPAAFDMSFAHDMRRGLMRLDEIGLQHRASQIALRDLLLPRRAELLRWLAETERFAEVAEANTGPLVLCHTDIGGDNNMVDAAGRVYILDWEDVALAPAEHDLQTFTDAYFPAFLDEYWQAGGVRQLDIDQFAFYYQRRYLTDLTDWLIRILEENDNAAQDAHDLAGIQTECLDKLDKLPAQVAEVTRMLAAASKANPHDTPKGVL